MSQWPTVRLDNVLNQVVDAHPVQADQHYPNFGIYSFGRGLFQKTPISGTATSAKNLYRVSAGNFIYSRLFAFEGAYGLVPEEFEGYFVSNEYPTFSIDRQIVLPEYLEIYFKSPKVWEEVSRLSSGMGDRRRRIQPEQFLTHSIPVPPLDQQRRIVAEMSKVQEAISLHVEVGRELDALYKTMLTRAFRGEP